MRAGGRDNPRIQDMKHVRAIVASPFDGQCRRLEAGPSMGQRGRSRRMGQEPRAPPQVSKSRTLCFFMVVPYQMKLSSDTGQPGLTEH